MPRFRTSADSLSPLFRRPGRFVHWYRDNRVYFLAARCRDRTHAFADEQAKAVFWDRFDHYTQAHGFVPWVSTLVDNHYHTLGYLRVGDALGPMMRKLHGSVAKLVNDRLPARLVPFWHADDRHDYFDGCIRDERQARRAYRYTLTQAVRHGITADCRQYPHTHVNVALEPAIKRALELKVFLTDVPYPRYNRPPSQSPARH